MRLTGLIAAASLLGQGSVTPSAAEAASIGQPAPAARLVPFVDCDGFSAPSRRGDSMTRIRGLLDGGEPAQERVDYGSGVEICDQALADPRLLPQWSLRRAHLLQARALHRAARAEPGLGLADLALSDQALAGDVYSQRSVGLGNLLIRSYLLLQTGNRVEAANAAARVLESRPYDPAISVAAARIHFAATGDWDQFSTNIRAASRLEPRLLKYLFAVSAMRGAFDDAADIYPQVDFQNGHTAGSGASTEDPIAMSVLDEALGAGVYAYALAANGQQERALAVLAAARASLSEANVRNSVGSYSEASGKRQAIATSILSVARQAEAILRPWERLVRLRGMAGGESRQAALGEIRAEPLPVEGASLDLLRELARVGPPEGQGGLQALARELEARLAEQVAQATSLDLDGLIDALPDAETQRWMPTYPSGSSPRIEPSRSAYRAAGADVESVGTINFGSRRGSMATANEIVLLRAAQLARESGRRGMVIVGRQGILTSVTQRMYGRTIGGPRLDQDVAIDVVFVDPTSLPEAFRGASWRVLDADAVWAALSPIYLPTEVAR